MLGVTERLNVTPCSQGVHANDGCAGDNVQLVLQRLQNISTAPTAGASSEEFTEWELVLTRAAPNQGKQLPEVRVRCELGKGEGQQW